MVALRWLSAFTSAVHVTLLAAERDHTGRHWGWCSFDIHARDAKLMRGFPNGAPSSGGHHQRIQPRGSHSAEALSPAPGGIERNGRSGHRHASEHDHELGPVRQAYCYALTTPDAASAERASHRVDLCREFPVGQRRAPGGEQGNGLRAEARSVGQELAEWAGNHGSRSRFTSELVQVCAGASKWRAPGQGRFTNPNFLN